MTKTLTAILMVLFCIILLPIIVGFCGGMFGLAMGIFGAVFGLIGSIFGVIFSIIGALLQGSIIAILIVVVFVLMFKNKDKKN